MTTLSKTIFILCLSVLGFINSVWADTGDLWLRELKMPGLGWVGHVAMRTNALRYDDSIYGRSEVLEVLNEDAKIQKNTIDNFYKRSKTLDFRYVRACGTCTDNHPRVIRVGWRQRQFSPSYSYSSTYREGKMVTKMVFDLKTAQYVPKLVMQTASFRCDSFVVFSFLRGVNFSFNTGSILLPYKLLQSVPKYPIDSDRYSDGV